MARQDFEAYYSSIKDQYQRTIQLLSDLGEQSVDKPVDPQVVQNLETVLAPVKNTYLQLAYIEYLLNLPKNKRVKTRNKQQFDKLFENIDDSVKPSKVLGNNTNAINKAMNLIDEEIG